MLLVALGWAIFQGQLQFNVLVDESSGIPPVWFLLVFLMALLASSLLEELEQALKTWMASIVFSVIIVLFIILRPRSGAALAVNELISVEEWTALMIPTTLIYLLMFLIFAGSLSYFLTLSVGKLFARKFANAPYSLIVTLTIIMSAILVFLFTGFMGLFILASATCLGFLPVFWGVRRSHCMGLLLIPIILHFL